MSDNVIPLRRRENARSLHDELGFYVRVSFNDHKELLDLLASGETGVFGFVIDASHCDRHADLITEALRRDLDVVLDPKTQALGTPGGFTQRLGALPWGGEEFHRASDFQGSHGQARIEELVRFALDRCVTQLIGPSHLLQGPNDQWVRRDVASMQLTHDLLRASGSGVQLIYSLALPIAVLRDPGQRQALMLAVADVPCDAIWLKVDNFGDDASGEKTAAYIDACRDFHQLGVPIISDMVGGLAGLGAVALGASGGIAHGVTIQQSFKASSWRREPDPQEGRSARLPARRVYIPELDLLLKPETARHLLGSSTRARALFGCGDTRCCPHGIGDMLDRPARHALFQRARELEAIAGSPESVRAQSFLDSRVRPVSDTLARAANFGALDESLRKQLAKKQTQVGGFRMALAHSIEANPTPTFATAPIRRSARQ